MERVAKYFAALAAPGDEENMEARLIEKKKIDKTWTIPFAMNTNFFGREKELDEIDGCFFRFRKSNSMSTVIIHGVEAAGKTQIALEYAWSRAKKFDVVLWISARNEYSIHQSLTNAALRALKLTDARETTLIKNSVLVMKWLETVTGIIASPVF